MYDLLIRMFDAKQGRRGPKGSLTSLVRHSTLLITVLQKHAEKGGNTFDTEP